MEKISIVIPVYNAEKYLNVCLDSVRNQTYEQFEVIMVNDGSNDRSEEICNEYVQKDSRFKLITVPNHGVSGARNIGLRHITGDYLALLDSDDWYDSDYLEYLYKGLKNTDADVFFCDFKTDGQPEYKWSDTTMTGQEALYQLFQNGCCNRVHNKLYKRNVIDGVFFPEKRDLCEDAVWTTTVLEKAAVVGRGSEAKCNICLTEGSITRKRYRTDKELCGYYRNLLEQCEIILRHYPSEPKDRNAVDKACNDRLMLILESGCNLNEWDVYNVARNLVNTHEVIIRESGSRAGYYIYKYKDYRKCVSHYFWDTVLSGREPLSHKKLIVRKRLGALARLLLKKTNRIS